MTKVKHKASKNVDPVASTKSPPLIPRNSRTLSISLKCPFVQVFENASLKKTDLGVLSLKS